MEEGWTGKWTTDPPPPPQRAGGGRRLSSDPAWRSLEYLESEAFSCEVSASSPSLEASGPSKLGFWLTGPGFIQLWVKHMYPNGILVSGNMDQNLRSPSGVILTHTHAVDEIHFAPPKRACKKPLLVGFVSRGIIRNQSFFSGAGFRPSTVGQVIQQK